MLYRMEVCMGGIMFYSSGILWSDLESIMNDCVRGNFEYKISIDENGELLAID